MEEQKEGLVTGEPQAPEAVPEVVNEPEPATPPEPQEEPKPEPVVKDDRPIENLYWETKRKVDDINEKLGQVMERLPQAGQTQQGQLPGYTKAQLRAFADTNPEHKVWAYDEIDKIEKSERQKEMESVFTKYKTQTEGEMRRREATNWVQSNPVFKECFIQDAQGNVAGWNPSHPLTRKIGEYMSHPQFANDPMGIMVAAKTAAFDLGISPTLSNKINKTIGQLRKEQKKQLVSSGGTRPSETPEGASKARLARLQEEYQKTGKSEVFAEIVKMRGLNPFV